MEVATTGLKSLKLSEIFISKTNPRPADDLTEEALKELTDSIRTNDVIHPILVRPKNGKYELVCGERRYRASNLAGKTEIACNVRELTDEQAFELQIVENLERKDVHPMYEAIAFQKLLDTKKYTIADLANKFVKTESFIVARLKLNDLIPAFQKDFLSGVMSISHAILAARLTAIDQTELHENVKQYNGDYGTANSFNEKIQRNIVNDLNSVPFKKDDATLIPAAGACTNCPKRSGCNTLMFPDVKDKNRCFDKKCFNEKVAVYTLNKLNEIITEHPEICIIKENWGKEPAKELLAVCKAHKIPVLTEYTDFNEEEGKLATHKGFYINGSDLGKIKSIRLHKPITANKKAAAGGKVTANTIKEDIANIEKREVRAKELDIEKVHTKIVAAMREAKEMITVTKRSPESAIVDVLAQRYLIYTMVSYMNRDTIREALGFTDDMSKESLFKKLGSLTTDQMALMVRSIILDKYGTHLPHNENGTMLRMLAETIKDIPIADYEAEQATSATKRQGRVQSRIDALKKQSESLGEPKKKAAPKKAAGTKPQPKKTASKKSTPKKAASKKTKK